MAFGSKENKTPVQAPAHIGIIMDGNGRWAKKRGLPATRRARKISAPSRDMRRLSA